MFLVIPAKAGIHELLSLDSRLRGSDGMEFYISFTASLM